MKKRIATLALAITLILPAGGIFAAKPKPNPTKPPAKPAAKVVSAVCPVMGTKIPDIRKASGKSVYKGKTYYFCCAGCKAKFDKNPEKYIHKKTK
jgi:YHS domain-containing protein